MTNSTAEVLRLVAQMEQARRSGSTAEEERKMEVAVVVASKVREIFNTEVVLAKSTNEETIRLFATMLIGAIHSIMDTDAQRLIMSAKMCELIMGAAIEELKK